ncbi:GNAT family N-acetyltransferase [Acerihabitans arboris]|uniref:GNAT family N-acetyltransferase n=1 Tax=Acerihabitans arboris TaxID=2691583 RepID=A0A845SRN4_9GAMM|nr:GNAT family N-acetyltransferase [Acerihabitans arboris]NDL65757.1 GNAT family N-acetyltransferase [Acerihabitans arboris]
MVEIRRYVPTDRQGVIDVIVPIQQHEFGIDITARDQPDLFDIPGFYQSGNGGFWVAVHDGKIVGTLGLKDIGASQAALRKMFVRAEFRGREHRVAARLLERLIAHAERQGVTGIFLGTTDKFLAAQRFYRNHGFSEVARAGLPAAFPVMAVDSLFFNLSLSPQ